MKNTPFNLACAIGMFLWLPFGVLTEVLVRTGVLNTKELSPLAKDLSTPVADYLLNAWYWDDVTFALLTFGAVCFLFLISKWIAQHFIARNSKLKQSQ
jgi:hypothetical protein